MGGKVGSEEICLITLIKFVNTNNYEYTSRRGVSKGIIYGSGGKRGYGYGLYRH